MPQPVEQSVALPTLSRGDTTVTSWAGKLINKLSALLSAFGLRINGSIHKDGGIAMAAPFQLMTYTIATQPTAATYPGCIIYVSDGAAGQKFRGSDGAAWVNLG